MSWWPLIAIGSAAGAAGLSTMQIALRQTGRGAVEALALAKQGEAAVDRLKPLMERDEHHAASIALPRIVFSLVCVVAAVRWVAAERDNPAPTTADIAIGVASSGVLLWIVAWLLPVALSKHVGPSVVLAFARPMRIVHVLLSPLAMVYGFIDEVVRRLAGDSATEQERVEREILSALDESEREGRIDETERDMIEAVVDLRSTTVEQIMTPRTETNALELTDDLPTILAFLSESGHSRVPVFEENLDHISGVLYAKDLLNWLTEHGLPGENGADFHLAPLLREAVFVPETKTVRELLAELLATRVHIAMIADEYGGTAGLVTIEDIVEEIFGEIRDEYDTQEEDHGLRPFDADTRSQEADARIELDEINDLLEPMGVELPESEDYDTLGGCVVVNLGRIPEAGDSLVIDRIKLTVVEAEPTRVVLVLVEVLEEDEAIAEISAEAPK